MKWLYKFWPFILIGIIVLFFFFPVFKGEIPFPGDLLVNTNPYSAQSFLGYAPGGYPNKAQGPDVITEIYPWRHFSVSQIKLGNIPFWNPYNFSGNPQMADFQTAVFYPLNLLYLILPFNLSWSLLILLQPLLAAIFMYLFLKRGIGLKDFASFIGGIAFGFCSYITVWIEYGNIGHTLLWLPLILLFTKQYFNKATAKNLFGISVSFIFAILAGYIQGVFYILVVSFLYYNYLVFKDKKVFNNHKKNFLFLISLLIPIVITSFQILPTLGIFANSTRGAYSLLQIEKNLLPVFNWITIFVPDFFGNPATRNYWIDGTYIERVLYPGTAILFFTAYAIFNKVKFTENFFFILLSIISLIIASSIPFIKYLYLIPIPVISTTVATRELSIFIFSIIVLGSMGLNKLLEDKEINKKFIFLFCALYLLIWAFVLFGIKFLPSLSQNLKISERNLILPSLFLAATIFSVFIKKRSLNFFIIMVLLIVISDSFYFFNKITPFSSQQLVYPKTPIISFLQEKGGINRFWGYGSGYIPPNFQTLDNTFSAEGNDPLHISSYGELLASSKDGKLPNLLPRPDANIAPGYGTEDLKNNFYRKRILDLLGIKYIINRQDMVSSSNIADLSTFPKDEYTFIKSIFPWQIYENKNALPRFFLAGNFAISKNNADTLSLIYNPNINLRKTIILANKPSIPINSNNIGKANLILYKPNQVIIKTNSTSNNLLFLSDNFYSQWGVKVDGKSSEILIADYTFRAVAVPKGTHMVDFYYKPDIFILGLKISVLGIIGLFIVLLYVKKNKKI